MTGSIIKRGEKNYLLRLSLGRDQVTNKRLYHTETVHGTKKDAETRLRSLLTEFERGTLAVRSTKSLNEFLEQWLASAKGRLRGRTHEDYVGLWERYLREGLGRFPLDKITSLRVQGVYSEMGGRGLSPLTVRRLHTVLNQALKQAVRWRMIGHNPAADVDLPANKGKKVIRAMTIEQALTFLDATLGHRWGMVLRFALRTGMRPGEYLALQWTDIDFTRSQASISKVLVRPKGGGWKFDEPKTAGSRRTVTLDSRDLEELTAYRAQQLQERLFAGERWQTEWDFVFTNDTGGPIFEHNLVFRAFKPLLVKAGLSDKFRLYDCRHTHATLLLIGGEHPKVVSERLGHASIAITLDTYSHVLPTMQAGAAKTIGDMLHVQITSKATPPPPGPKVVSIASGRRS